MKQRTLRGSIGTTYLLKLPPDLDEASRKDAKRLRLSLAEWWRQAGRVMLAMLEEREK